MRIIKSTDRNGLTMYFDRISDAIDESEIFFDEAILKDWMKYEIIEITQEEFNALPETERV
jgi:hypothetical protein